MNPANVSTGINYARDIVAGNTPACEQIKKACHNFLKELDTAPEGYQFSRQHAAKALAFIQHLKHTKGHTAGEQFYLLPWQAWIIINLFGWIDVEGLRRFSKAYIAVPRKNGKSTLAAAIMLYFLIADGEAAAECYTVATKMEQAKIIWEEAYRMAQDSPVIGDELKYANSDRIKYLKFERSELKPLVSEDKTLDGLNPHAVALDEYHAHRNDNSFNVLLTGMGARKQPMMFTVTIAGFGQNSPALKYQRYCEKVIFGQVHDPNTFAAIWTIDQADQWTDPSVWQKANPNWGISVNPKKLHQDFREAQEMAHKEVEFKTKYLNIWTDSAVTWIQDAKWMLGNKPLPAAHELAKMPCYAGLDLGSTSDLTHSCAYGTAAMRYMCSLRSGYPKIQ
jgi:phage terminase large subunit-like protein